MQVLRKGAGPKLRRRTRMESVVIVNASERVGDVDMSYDGGLAEHASMTRHRAGRFMKLDGMEFAGKCAEYSTDSTDVLPGHGR